MKQTPSKKITSMLLALTLMLTMVALPSMGTTVQAADAEVQTGLQDVVIGAGTNPTPTVIGFGGKVCLVFWDFQIAKIRLEIVGRLWHNYR